LPDVCDQLAVRGIRVIVAGLDMDYKARPFGQMPNLLAKAEYITKLHAICVKCGNIANYSYRKEAGDNQIMLGEMNIYEPRCRHCYYTLP
jgi:thymidine kinase